MIFFSPFLMPVTYEDDDDNKKKVDPFYPQVDFNHKKTLS